MPSIVDRPATGGIPNVNGSDSTTWSGYDMAVTTQVGPVVVSLSALTQNSDGIETYLYPTHIQRKREELRVGTGIDTFVGPVRISPRLEVGAAWLESKRIDAVPFDGPVYDVFCDSDPFAAVDCSPGAPVFFGDGFSDKRTELVTTLKATASLPIVGRLALTLGLTIDALPFASADPIPSKWAEMESSFNPDMQPEAFAIPANARLRAGVSIGLSLGL